MKRQATRWENRINVPMLILQALGVVAASLMVLATTALLMGYI